MSPPSEPDHREDFGPGRFGDGAARVTDKVFRYAAASADPDLATRGRFRGLQQLPL
jgi:hypothetical protein